MNLRHVFASALTTGIALVGVHVCAEESEEKYLLAPFVVQASAAGQFSAGAGAGATLKPMEIMTTPGSAADINRALQTLPGVQSADEGNALFVRGGDSRETATWINGIKFPGLAQLNAPIGTYTGSVSPWQASAVEFAAGGFGARTGDVLSGAVKIKTVGAPRNQNASVNLGIGNVAAGVNWPWSESAGVSLSATRTDLSTFFDLFKPKRGFEEPPHGFDASIAGSWDLNSGGRVKWFGIVQKSEMALRVDDVQYEGLYRSSHDTEFGVVLVEQKHGSWSHEISLGAGATAKEESVGSSRWATGLRARQATYTGSLDRGSGVWRFGADVRAESAEFDRVASGDESAETEERSFSSGIPETQSAVWLEYETLVAPRVRAIAGLRAWHSTRADEAQVEPRISLTWQPVRPFAASIAGGVYHQVPEGIHYAEGRGRWPAMRSEQIIASLEWKQGARLLRVEAYEKRSARLVALDRNYSPRGGGSGSAHGIDVLAKTPLPGDVSARVTWSFVDATRTDPNTGVESRAPWAVTHSASLVLDRAFGNWKVSVAGRWATGRAFTPIGGAELQGGRLRPIYGEPNSQRYPSFRRIDCTLTRVWELSDRITAAGYIAGFNLFGWENVQSYSYSDDFSERRAVPALFRRSVYFGVNLIYR